MTSKSKIIIAPGAVVCKECELKGEVTIGSRTVIHPKARIIAEAGPIIIGENNLIEEQVQILNGNNENSDVQTVMVIGTNNVFEVGARVEALKIGDNNVLESKCFVGRCTELTSGCVIGAKCEITYSEVIPENSIICGSNCERRIQVEKPACWTDYKKIKQKLNHNRVESNKTGGGAADLKEITPLEERVIQLLGMDAVEGLALQESSATLDHFSDRNYNSPNERENTSSPIFVVPDINTEDPGSQIFNIAFPPTDEPTTSGGRLGSMSSGTRKTRTRGMVLRYDGSKKLIEVQEATALALNKVAVALAKDNETMVQHLQIETRRLDIEERKATALEQLASHFVQNYP